MFDFDVVEHETKGTPFEFAGKGKKWRVPHVSDLTIGQQRAADQGAYELIMRHAGEVWDERGKKWKPAGQQGAALFLEMHSDQVGKFRAAWLAHGGLKPGESRASSR